MMTRPLSARRRAALLLGLSLSVLSCGREVTGPGGPGALAALRMAPDFSSMVDSVGGVQHSLASLVPFTKVRIELRRIDNSVAASSVVDFPPNATQIPLSIEVRLSAAANEGREPLTAYLRYINASGDTVFAGGPVSVVARAGKPSDDDAVEVPIQPTAPGAVFARLRIAPSTLSGRAGSTVTVSATAFDAQDNVVNNPIIGYLSRDTSVAKVPALGQGTVNLVGLRGETWVVAQSLTGLKDSARVRVLPVPTQLQKISGDAQTVPQGAAFAAPLRVRLLAADNLPVAGDTITFAVTAGGGSLSASKVATDSAGYASVSWTAGSTIGAASVTASLGTLTVTFTGTQENAGPAALLFKTQPVDIVVGDTLPPIVVAVLNARDEILTDFTGTVSLTLTGSGIGKLLGDTAVTAVNGIATFSGLTVDHEGKDYQLKAVLPGVPDELSDPFTVLAPEVGSGLRINFTSPVGAARYFVIARNGPSSSFLSSVTLLNFTRSGVLDVNLPVGAGYRVQIVAVDSLSASSMDLIAAAGASVTDVSIVEGKRTTINATLAPITLETSVPTSLAAGQAFPVDAVLTDPSGVWYDLATGVTAYRGYTAFTRDAEFGAVSSPGVTTLNATQKRFQSEPFRVSRPGTLYSQLAIRLGFPGDITFSVYSRSVQRQQILAQTQVTAATTGLRLNLTSPLPVSRFIVAVDTVGGAPSWMSVTGTAMTSAQIDVPVPAGSAYRVRVAGVNDFGFVDLTRAIGSIMRTGALLTAQTVTDGSFRVVDVALTEESSALGVPTTGTLGVPTPFGGTMRDPSGFLSGRPCLIRTSAAGPITAANAGELHLNLCTASSPSEDGTYGVGGALPALSAPSGFTSATLWWQIFTQTIAYDADGARLEILHAATGATAMLAP